MLSHALQAHPDALHDDLAAVVPLWPTRPVADQYRAPFPDLDTLSACAPGERALERQNRLLHAGNTT
nr:hypothetical protein KPHV_81610 [Kitasatospora purpeofusca]